MSDKYDDAEVDRVLKNAGAEWRARQPAAPQPDLARVSAPRSSARRWVPALAAAGVAAIALGAIVFVPHRSGSEPTVVGQASSGPRASGPQEDLVVHDGDTVTATGQVLAAPGKPVVFCPNLPTDMVAYLPGHEPAPVCPAQFAVPVTGVDLTKLAEPRTIKGVTAGGATLRGTWRDRSIEVQQQSAPVPPVADEPSNAVPCTAPAAGWKSGPWGDSGEKSQALAQYVDAHPDRFAGLRIAYPAGPPKEGSTAPVVEVIVVGVATGDLKQARTDLEKLYDGNLCVTTATASKAQLDAVQQAVQPMFQQQKGVYGSGGAGDGTVDVDLLVVDQALYGEFQKIGLDLLTLRPAVRPVS